MHAFAINYIETLYELNFVCPFQRFGISIICDEIPTGALAVEWVQANNRIMFLVSEESNLNVLVHS